jgi:hypothetical protein
MTTAAVAALQSSLTIPWVSSSTPTSSGTAAAVAAAARWNITLQHHFPTDCYDTACNGADHHSSVETKRPAKCMALKVYAGTSDQSLRRAILSHFQLPLTNLLQLRDCDGDDVPISAALPSGNYTAIAPSVSATTNQGNGNGHGNDHGHGNGSNLLSSYKRARLSASSSSSFLLPPEHSSPLPNSPAIATTPNNTGRLSISRTRSNSLANGILAHGSDITLRLPSTILEIIFSWCSLPSIASYICLSYSHQSVARAACERMSHMEIMYLTPTMATITRSIMMIPRRLVSLTINFIIEYELDAFKMGIINIVTLNQATLRHIHLVPEEIIGSLLFIAIQGCRLLETLILPRVARHDTNYSDVLVPISQTCPRLSTFGVESGIATLADIMEFLKSDLQLKEFKFRYLHAPMHCCLYELRALMHAVNNIIIDIRRMHNY